MSASATESTGTPRRDCDAEIWCEECGELGWEGVCPACRELPPPAG